MKWMKEFREQSQQIESQLQMMEEYGESFKTEVAYFRDNDPEYKFNTKHGTCDTYRVSDLEISCISLSSKGSRARSHDRGSARKSFKSSSSDDDIQATQSWEQIILSGL